MTEKVPTLEDLSTAIERERARLNSLKNTARQEIALQRGVIADMDNALDAMPRVTVKRARKRKAKP